MPLPVEVFGYVPSNHSGRPGVDCEFECPTIQAYPTNVWLWCLTVLYGIVAIASIIVMMKGTSRMVSFRNVFLGMQAMLCLQRVIVFSVEFDWNLFTLLLVMYCLPIFFQFVTFSLLIVFLIKCLLVMQERGHLVKRYLYPTFTLIVLGLGGACFFVSYNSWKEENDSYDESLNKGFDQGVTKFAVAVFGVLTFCIAITGYKAHRMLMRFVLSEARQRQVSGVSWVVTIYCFIFCVRALWSLLYMLNDNWLQNKMNGLQQNNAHMYYLTILIFYLVFELLPTSFLLWSLHRWAKPGTSGYAKIPNHDSDSSLHGVAH